MEKLILSQKNVEGMATRLFMGAQAMAKKKLLTIYGVPRGGIPVAYLVKACAEQAVMITSNPREADVIVDDITDSGRTKKHHEQTYGKPFLSLCDYIPPGIRERGAWVVFPWEHTADGEDASADDIVIRLLQFIGEDPERGGLKETPARVLKAWKEWTSGYGKDPASVLKCFEDGGENYDEMVWQEGLPFYSHCEHHLAPFFGTCTIAYIPNKRVVGLSKLGRIMNIFAKRLQVQERLTSQIADALWTHLSPKGVGVIMRARHLCMESRGVAMQGHQTITSALRGNFLEDAKVRSEFLTIASA